MNFEDLISSLSSITNQLKLNSIRAVNISLTFRNWYFGFYIVEFEQNGKDRAVYGKSLLSNIAVALKKIQVSNIDERELRRYRQFYLVYPNVQMFFNADQVIRGLLPPELLDKSNLKIREMSSPKLEIPISHFQNLFKNVSYSHFVELIRIDDNIKRLFYENECIKGIWSVNELKRQIGSMLYDRTGLSKNKELLLTSISNNTQQIKAFEVIRDPYIFEFIGLKQEDVLYEKNLEKGLLDNL